MDKKILVVTSCTGEKFYKPSNQLSIKDFQNQQRLKKRERELSQYQLPAEQMYTGKQHLHLMEGVREYRSQGGKIDVAILSAGYGMLREEDPIVPYEVTFNSMGGNDIREWSNHLSITTTLQNWISNYDLIFFLLGDKYLQAIQWPLETSLDQKLVFFAGESSKKRILTKPNHFVMTIGENEASTFHKGLIEIKGFLFSQLLYSVGANRSWNTFYNNPLLIKESIIDEIFRAEQICLFENNRENQLVLLPFYQYPYIIPKESHAKNSGVALDYFMPENEDRVDPRFDFTNDSSHNDRIPLKDDVYAHEIYDAPQYDGILISKVNIDHTSQKKKKLIGEVGIRKFLRLPDDYPIMGDCGAFSYIKQTEPSYSTDEVLDYYQSLGFDVGVSVDHLIVGPYQADEKERNRRYELTLKNAHEFIIKHRKKGYTFTPMGVVQGWDEKSFCDAVQSLIEMGYDHIALGGLALEKSDKILRILKRIAPIIPNDNFRLHLFGVARNMEVMKAFHQLGVTSFDSASPLRKAWLGSEHNYHKRDKHYAAIRIPEAKANKGRVKKQIQEYLRSITRYYQIAKRVNQDTEQSDKVMFLNEYIGLEKKILKILNNFDQGIVNYKDALQEILNSMHYLESKAFKKQGNNSDYCESILNTFMEYKELEKNALEAVRAYDKGDFDLSATLNAILDYDKKLGEKRDKHAVLYKELLKDQPWKSCGCNICKQIGVEVVIFRGNNRNRRRGFHNTYIYYQQIKELKNELLTSSYQTIF